MTTMIRCFAEPDVPFGMKLKTLAGWNQLEADWRRFVRLQPDGCFLAERDGQPAGTATTTQFGDRFGWVGMVLVHPDMRRKGIGSALLEHCIKYLEDRGVAAVKLDATPLGKKLYDTLGFVDEYHLERKQVAAPPAGLEAGAGVAAMTDADLGPLAAYDAAIFGADRALHLRLLFAQRPEACFVHRDVSRAIDGYVFSRPGANAFQIGPWAADHDAGADGLLRAALATMPGAAVLLDVPLTQPGPSEIVRRYGFETQRPLIRMYRGDNAYPGDVGRAYAFCGPETG